MVFRETLLRGEFLTQIGGHALVLQLRVVLVELRNFRYQEAQPASVAVVIEPCPWLWVLVDSSP